MTKRIAITGFSFRLPQTNQAQFWKDLIDGRDLISQVAPERWSQDVFLHPNRKPPGTAVTFAAGSLGDISGFDAEFFGISPREAAQMDPQQRLLLEMSWDALENGGIRPSAIRGSNTGVFIGIASTEYAYRLAEDFAACDASTITGNAASIAANRISFVFDFHGPSMALDTACSSALVAFHQACRSILSGEITMALTGGISLHLHPFGFIGFSKASMLSASGRCHVFDVSGDGYVRSEGGGIFVLKDYDQAVADGDPILAVVAATAINTDGHKSGLTVPNPETQAELLRQVYATAGLGFDEIDYLEAHGTGTAVGDPIEARAIGEAIGKYRNKDEPLWIGSVKSNLGHLETASGVASLVKALLCLCHRMIPATIGIQRLNPQIPFRELNLDVVTENRPLKPAGRLVVGVNSFGFGGTNAHVILESCEQPTQPRGKADHSAVLPVLISGKSPAALKAAARQWADWLKNAQSASLYDIAYNSLFRRDWHKHRAIVFADSADALAVQLHHWSLSEKETESHYVATGTALENAVGPVFVYTGNGSQWAGMGKRLLEDPVFLAAVRKVDEHFQPLSDFSLEKELADTDDGADRYARAEISQPALFALQVGITSMLRQQGIEPVAVVGHSVGEVAAALACGALSLKAAVAVIFHRSHAQGKTKGMGQMRAVGLGYDGIRELLDGLKFAEHLCVAAVNSPCRVTIAGSSEALSDLEAVLNQRSVVWRRLDLDYAFHSPAMDGIESDIRSSLACLQPQAATIPFYSTVAGSQLDGARLAGDYWWQNIRQPVQFGEAVRHMQNELGANLFIEIGPQPVLRAYINDCMKERGRECHILPTVLRNDDDPMRVHRAAALCMLGGGKVNWQRHFSQPAPFAQLPNYPWQRERHWHPVTPESQGTLTRHRLHSLLGYALPLHTLTWENQLDTVKYPSLADHRVGTAVVFPGAAFAELALAAAHAWQPADIIEIEDLEIHAPLLLSNEHSKLLRFMIDERDGRFHIQARQYAKAEPWTRHVTGRRRPHPVGLPLLGQNFLIPERHPDFTGEDHYRHTQALGLAYGTAFQCITHGWVEDNAVWAALQTPDSASSDLAETLLHPALLDCAFQLVVELLRDDPDLRSGIAFVPTRLGRLRYRAVGGQPAFARAVLVKRNPHSLTAAFALFAADGQIVATIEEASFRSVRLLQDTDRQLRFLGEHLVPSPHPLAGDEPITVELGRLHASLRQALGTEDSSSRLRRYGEEVEPLLDVLCSSFIREALEAISSNEDATHAYLPQNIFLSYVLRLALEDGSIAVEEGAWRLVPEDELPVPACEVWKTLVTDYLDYAALMHAIGTVGLHLPALLRGDLPVERACPPTSSMSAFIDDALTAEARCRIGQGLRAIIADLLSDLPTHQRLGVLQVGNALSGFSHDICAALDFDRCDYVFASPSAQAVEAFGEIREHYPLAQTRLIEDAPAADRLCPLVIVHQDHHDEARLLTCLEYAARHLAPAGVLVVLGFHPARWLDFIFAAHGGWLQGHDSQLVRSPLRPAQYWQDRLRALGCRETDRVDLAPGTFSGAYLLLAQKDKAAIATVAQSDGAAHTWLILVDPEGLSAELGSRLACQLQTHSDHVTCASWPTQGELLPDLREALSGKHSRLDGVVFLAGLQVLPEATGPAAVLDYQVTRCAAAAALTRWCEPLRTRCWIVTMGAMDESASRAETGAGADSALWGFGRVLQNECESIDSRLVDLHPCIDMDTAVAALDRELHHPDAETEVVMTQGGQRFAVRLRERSRPAPAAGSLADPVIRLGFEFPGQLSDLRWEAHPPRPLREDEVEIEVKATGLNFRDVMHAQGLLPDSAIDNGFSGASLGLEFSGIVRRLGSQVHHLTAGDAVLGFGPAAFANRVITTTQAVTHLPDGVSFEAAATIPTAFFTVYYALKHLARLEPGETILIHGAAGGVGMAAIQLAQWIGAEIHATAGSDAKRDFLRLMGVQYIYDSRSLAFADEILSCTGGQGVDVVLNSLAGEAIRRNLQVLKPFGRFLELGKRDFYENTHIGLRPFRNNISYFGIDADQLMQANPHLTQQLFCEMMALFKDGALSPLPYRVFDCAQVVNAFRHMQQSRHIGKVVVSYHNGFANVEHPRHSKGGKLTLAADATYLVTGGLSGFGLKTAEWLAERGARHLVLISRSGPRTDEANTAIERLTRQGIEVLGTACDVTDAEAVERLLVQIRASRPPLRGIVHAAAMIDDALVRNLDQDKIRKVLAPKVVGALHLHRATQALPLDFFVLFSSATTLFGNPGQAAYVAANTYLGTLARARRRVGLAATCVCWGAINDVGFLARNEKIKTALQQHMGGAALNSAAALEVLDDLLAGDHADLGVLTFDWSTMARFLPTASAPKFIQQAARARDHAHVPEDSADIQQMLQRLSGTALRTAVIDLLKGELGKVLGLSPEKIDADRSLHDMGLDSLMGVELTLALGKRFGVNLPVMVLSENPTLSRLAQRVLELIKRDEQAEHDDPAAAQIAQIAAQHGVDANREVIVQFAQDIQAGRLASTIVSTNQ
jgi:acyl transferase domain-containing protein/NADPH:quinone reductase-like Zn-dependent oxidoreductase/acyl carrier protein